MAQVTNIGKTDDYVYDISLDGSVVDAMTWMVVSNTDGMNFKMPDTFRYTDDHPYIGKGLNRDVTEGKTYTGVEADVMEFDDLFMRSKMGLGIDEFANATINLSRKNYMDYLSDGTTKKVGNTIKSKKMPTYIEKFIDSSADLLLFGKGKEFLESYYDYIDKIYNYKIPLRDIASKGKIKKTLKQYRDDCKTVTKSGTKKPRQAWYELLLKEENPYVEIGDTVYYINTGKRKDDSDVKRISVYYQDTVEEGKKDVTKELNSAFTRYKSKCKKMASSPDSFTQEERDAYLVYDEKKKANVPRLNKLEIFSDTGKERQFINSPICKEMMGEGFIHSEDELIMNCVLLDRKVVDSDEDTFCDESIEYNVVKYISQFNNRIKPLLVCFSKTIRESILITNPEDRKYFTDDEARLSSGEPNKKTDQDTYEELMTMDRREVAFWISVNEKPPFVDECGLDWQKIKDDYYEQLKLENNEKFQELDAKYMECLQKLTAEDIEKVYEDGTVPDALGKLVFLKEDGTDLRFHFRELPDMTPSTGGYIFDDISYDNFYAQIDATNEYSYAVSEDMYNLDDEV